MKHLHTMTVPLSTAHRRLNIVAKVVATVGRYYAMVEENGIRKLVSRKDRRNAASEDVVVTVDCDSISEPGYYVQIFNDKPVVLHVWDDVSTGARKFQSYGRKTISGKFIPATIGNSFAVYRDQHSCWLVKCPIELGSITAVDDFIAKYPEQCDMWTICGDCVAAGDGMPYRRRGYLKFADSGDWVISLLDNRIYYRHVAAKLPLLELVEKSAVKLIAKVGGLDRIIRGKYRINDIRPNTCIDVVRSINNHFYEIKDLQGQLLKLGVIEK